MDGSRLEADLRTAWGHMGFTVKEFDLSEPFYIPVDDPRVTALMALYKDVTGRDDPPYAMGGGTYSRAVPGAISFGPGMPGSKRDYSAFLPEGHGGAHGRDEVLPIDKLLTCSKIYVAALAELDGVIE
jgi:succinyl-diaminopimelate desuccinylase